MADLCPSNCMIRQESASCEQKPSSRARTGRTTWQNIKRTCKIQNKNMNNPIKKWTKDLNRNLIKEGIPKAYCVYYIYIYTYTQMLNLTSYVNRELQIKTILWYHSTCTRLAQIYNMDNTKCWRACGETETLIHCCWEWKMMQLLWKTNWQLTKFTTSLPFDLVIMLLGIFPQGAKILYLHKYLQVHVYSSFFFLIAKT